MEPHNPNQSDLPEARRLDYAPAAPPRRGMFWRAVIAVISAGCLAIGMGMAVACVLSQDHHDAVAFGGLAGGFLTAGVALPAMTYLARRL